MASTSVFSISTAALSRAILAPVTGVLWNFGDATTSTAAAPTHVYQNPGNYTVTPSKTEITFTPTNRAVTLSPNASAVNFAGITNTYTVSFSSQGGSSPNPASRIVTFSRSISTRFRPPKASSGSACVMMP